MSILNSPAALVERWPLQGTPDGGLGRYDGTATGVTWPASFLKNSLSVAELDGTAARINVGDVVELNAVDAFTLCFWMAQDVLDQVDAIFYKRLDAADHIQVYTHTDGNMYVVIDSSGESDIDATFDYSAVISANVWAHVAVVYDGSQTGNANKLLVYVDGAPVTLAFTGTVPVVTPDLAGIDATIGSTDTNSFDGRLFDFRIYNRALSRQQVNTIIHAPLALI